MGALIVMLIGLLVIGGIAWLVVWAKRTQEAFVAAWRAVAEARPGAQFDPGKAGLLSHRPASIHVLVGQAFVRVDTYVVSTGKSSTTYTRARAAFPVGAGPVFRVYQQGMLASIGKALGTQDVTLGGDPAFDERFMVKCDDPEATGAAWTRRAKALMKGFSELRASSDGELITLVLFGARKEPAILNGLMDLAGELASYGARELAQAAQKGEARYEGGSGRWDVPSRPRLRIGTPRGEVQGTVVGGHPGLRLELAPERAVPAFRATIGGGEVEGLPPGVLTEGATRLLPALEGATISSEPSALRLWWPTVPGGETVGAGAR
ncbi:MAG TPA: hypothetical protein RMH26_13605, partial [Polyangiaceae bacterium LLY-WYZ-15_(1-7)]|nr:hypothetical protein [Polyangiaceae bacterium LLY-WYZ-15_(1-7)]